MNMSTVLGNQSLDILCTATGQETWEHLIVITNSVATTIENDYQWSIEL